MNITSRLERLERSSKGNRPIIAVSILEPCETGYRLTASLYRPGGGAGQIISDHATAEAAEAEFQRLCEKYRAPCPEPVLIDLGL